MALKYTLKYAPIMDGEDEALTVRGLSLNDIVQLLIINRPAIETMFDKFANRDVENIDDSEVADVAMGMIESAPGLVAHVISLAADAVDHFDDVLKLPTGIQVAALEKIGEMTFSAGGGPKKMLGLALKMFKSGQTAPLQP